MPADAAWKDKYPLPVDAFTILTVIMPGALVLLMLPTKGFRNAASDTLFYHALNPAKWYAYTTVLAIAFIVGLLVDAIGRNIRLFLQERTAAEQQKRLAPALSNALERVLSFSSDRDPKPVELKQQITTLIAIASQVQRGKAFRLQDRTLAMVTNLAVALAFSSSGWLLRPWWEQGYPEWADVRLVLGIISPSVLLLAATVLYILPRWWTDLLLAAGGADFPSFHEAQLAEKRRLENLSEEILRVRVEEEKQDLTTKLEIAIASRNALSTESAQLKQEVRDWDFKLGKVFDRQEDLKRQASALWEATLQLMTASSALEEHYTQEKTLDVPALKDAIETKYQRRVALESSIKKLMISIETLTRFEKSSTEPPSVEEDARTSTNPK